MILKIKRTRYSSVDHRSTVYASEINCPEVWPDGLEVEDLRGNKKIYARAETNSGFARYQSQDDEHITVLKD